MTLRYQTTENYSIFTGIASQVTIMTKDNPSTPLRMTSTQALRETRYTERSRSVINIEIHIHVFGVLEKTDDLQFNQ